MKNITISRHAKSSWDNPNLTDFERTLNQRGTRDAEFISNLVAKMLPKPDLFFSSPAQRAFETSLYYAQAFGMSEKEIIYDKGIYDKGIRYIINTIQILSDAHQNILLIGHNPDLTAFCTAFSGQYFDNIPTSGVVSIDFDVNTWQEAMQKIGTLKFYEYPKKYFKKD
jgi:phosphohistidine phosphatase